MDKIKIAIIRPIGHPIDLKSYNCQEIGLAKGLTLQGIDVDVFLAGDNPKPEKNRISSQGEGEINIYQLPFYKIPEIDHAIYPHLKNILIRNQYNLFHVNEENEITSFLVARLGKKIGVPVVIYQGMYQQISGRTRAAFQTIYDYTALPWLRKNIHLALTKTTSAEKHLQRKGFKKTLVIPVGLDISPFKNSSDTDWRIKLKINDQIHIILYIGIFEKRRNIDFMLDLAKKLINRTNLIFLYVGKGPEFESVKDRIKGENIYNVRLLGHTSQKELPSLYKESSLFLLPSNYEIYGMVALEAMYFGVPVISTKTAGPIDIISNDEDGILLDKLDLTVWVDRINKLIGEPHTLEKMSRKARLKIKKNLTWPAVAEGYYKKVIEKLDTKCC